MVIALFAFGLLLIGIGCVVYWRDLSEEGVIGCIAWGCGGVSIVISIIMACVSWHNIAVQGPILEQQIAMYEQENAVIEENVAKIVQNYLTYEHETYEELKPEYQNSITVASLYPKLSGDTVVTKQIETYMANRQTIFYLKDKKIGLSKYHWLLYLGFGD